MGFYCYNDCYGGYVWSEGAIEEIRRRLGMPDASASKESKFLGITLQEEKYRTHPVVNAVLQEWGSQRCSGACSVLVHMYVPDELLQYVELYEYDGSESISINTERLYRTMMEDVLRKPSFTTDDVVACRNEIQRLEELAERRWDDFFCIRQEEDRWKITCSDMEQYL